MARIGSEEWYWENPMAPEPSDLAEEADDIEFDRKRAIWRAYGRMKPGDWEKRWNYYNQKSIEAGYGELPF